MNSKTATVKPVLETVLPKGNSALTVVNKKKMSVQEKIDSLNRLEGLVSKVSYLRERKIDIEKFGKGANGFQGAKISLECVACDDVTVSNPAIVEELLTICKLRIKDLLIKAEKEVEDFEIV